MAALPRTARLPAVENGSALLVSVGLGGAERPQTLDQFFAAQCLAACAGAQEDVRMQSEVLI